MSPPGDPLLLPLRDINTVNAVVAVAGAAWLAARAAGPIWSRFGPRQRRLWDAGLAALGLLGAVCWTNLGQFNFPGFGHPSETYHYYLGAKYFPELGYTRLYECALVADAAAPGGAERVAGRRLRNLTTNTVEPGDAVLADPARCTRHFSPERWQAFQRDLAWFRDRPNPRRWRVLQLDHGYNATPVWGLFGRLLAAGGPASDSRILALRLLDPLLLAAAFGVVWRTFGWRTLCVALLFFGTHYPTQFGWTGGSYLRQLELAAALTGICALRAGHARAAGALVALAGLVRIHPGFLALGPACQVLVRSLAARRPVLSLDQTRLLVGGLAGAAVLLALGAAVAGGPTAWRDFARNSQVLMDTPLRNHLGLPTLLAWHPERTAEQLRDPTLDDAYAPWKQARRDTFAERRPLYLAALVGVLGLFAWAVQRQPLWVAVALGAGVVPFAVELTGYYSVLLVTFALLFERMPWAGVGLVALAAAGWGIVEVALYFDPIFTGLSLATLVYAAGVMLACGLGARPKR